MVMPRSERLRGPQSALLRAALYYARKRRLRRLQGGSSGPATYSQNRYQDLVGSNIQKTGYTVSSRYFEFSFWFKRSASGSSMRIFSELNDTQVLINSSGTITIEVHSSGNLRIFDATTTDATSEGVDYHLYFQYDAQTQTYDFRLDGVSLTPGSGLNVSVNSGGDCALNSTLNLFSLTNGTQPFIGDFGDLWVHCTDNPQGYSSFADESGQPKDLSSLPTPDIWLGGDLTAADINSGDNLGLVPTPLDVVAGNFTDL